MESYLNEMGGVRHHGYDGFWVRWFSSLAGVRCMKRYLINIAVSLDQLVNTLLAGYPDETLSSRMGKKIRDNECLLCKGICKVLGWIDPGHCRDSIEHDEGEQ